MKKKTTRKTASKVSTKTPILALSETDEKELTIDPKTYEKLEKLLAKNGGKKAGLTLSDIVAHMFLEKGPNGFKFSILNKEPRTVRLKLPKAAWDIAEKTAKKSGVTDLSEVLKELVSRY